MRFLFGELLYKHGLLQNFEEASQLVFGMVWLSPSGRLLRIEMTWQEEFVDESHLAAKRPRYMYVCIYIYTHMYANPPPCAYIFLSLQEDTYKKQTFLGRRPTFQLANFSGPNFPFFQFSNFSGPDFGMLESWKVKSRKIGKLENWKNGKLGPEKLENWKLGKMAS